MTVIEVLIFVVSNTIYGGNPHYMNECSWLIYNPYRRQEIWRFLTYMFVHGSTMHLIFNLCAQLFVALPLEMVHGARRVGAVYLLGVLAGSLFVSVFDLPNKYLCGASGGVYALIFAHLASLA